MTSALRDATWSRNVNVLWRTMDAGLLLLAPEAEEPVLLDSVAPTIWDMLAEPVQFREAVAVLAEVFATEPEIIEADLSRFLETLLDFGAVECR